MQSKEHDYKVFSEMPKAYQCAVCGRSHLKRRRPIKVKPLQKYVSKLINREIQEDDVICDKCRALYKKSVINLSQVQKGASRIKGIMSDEEESEFVVDTEKTICAKLQSPKNISLHAHSTICSHK